MAPALARGLLMPGRMKIALASVLLVACTSSNPPDKVVAPDPSVLQSLYPDATRGAETSAPFSIDLATCAYAKHQIAVGQVEGGNQYAMTHLDDNGMCEVWVGYEGNTGLHGDVYCSFEPSGTIEVTNGQTGMGGCGGPPGTQPLTITSDRCVTLAF